MERVRLIVQTVKTGRVNAGIAAAKAGKSVPSARMDTGGMDECVQCVREVVTFLAAPVAEMDCGSAPLVTVGPLYGAIAETEERTAMSATAIA